MLTLYPTTDWDALVTLAYADAYWAAMGDPAWTGAPEVKEAAIRRGTRYIMALQPVASALDPVIHGNVQEATCEAAIRSINGTLYAETVDQAVLRESVGPLAVRYAEPKSRKRFSVIEDLLRGLIAGSSQIGLVRA